MKLTNHSLAILVAVGVAACGGSDDNNSNRPVDPKTPSTPDNNNNNNNNNNNQAENPQTVDPTGTHVVDNKDLTEVSTVGTLQYIRREGSQYDRANNPSKPASASPLLGVTLNDQNPSLTNIVLARQELVRADGQPVKAQFAGSDDPKPLNEDGTFRRGSKASVSLQEENYGNVDILAGMYQPADVVADKHVTDNVTNNKIDTTKRPLALNKNIFNAVVKGGAAATAGVFDRTLTNLGDAVEPDNTTTATLVANNNKAYNLSPRDWSAAASPIDGKNGPGVYSAKAPVAAATDVGGYTAIIDRASWKKSKQLSASPATYGLDDKSYYKDGKDGDGKDLYYYRGDTYKLTADGKNKELAKKAVTAAFANSNQGGSRYGQGLIWWSTPETAFDNEYTRRGTTINATDFDASQPDFANSAAATNGLIRVGGGLSTLGEELKYDSATGKWEDHHNTTTRIFGRYHLAYADQSAATGAKVKQVSLNSYSGAKTFVAEYETNTAGTSVGKASQYSLGAVPMTLKYVQYGRVSNDLDLDAGETGFADNFMRSGFVHKNSDNGVDNYFYRGTDATSIEQMAALPSNQTAVYHGHALMYGIDNSYHGSTGNKGRDLPNAFAPAASGPQGIGLGNFVEARVNFGNKRVTGEVYNTWLLDPSKNTTTKDKLVQFQGAITGNTVVGTADRVYGDTSVDDNATFKASFFGDKAQELGGSFNSVKDADKYGDAYGTNDWGGVFGATRGETNTFQGDDKATVYSD